MTSTCYQNGENTSKKPNREENSNHNAVSVDLETKTIHGQLKGKQLKKKGKKPALDEHLLDTLPR